MSALLPDKGNNLDGVKSVSAGLDFALFYTRDGIYVTGANTFGQLCVDPSLDEIFFSPAKLLGMDSNEFDGIAAGTQSSYILFVDGSVSSCGLNDGKKVLFALYSSFTSSSDRAFDHSLN